MALHPDFGNWAAEEEIPTAALIQTVAEETYCSHCHLATPTWRKRCIHCHEPLNPEEPERPSRGPARKEKEQ